MRRLIVRLIPLFIVVGAFLIAMDRSYENGYDNGKFDSQSQCIIEQEIQDKIKLEQAIEDVRWQCAAQKQEIIRRYEYFCTGVRI